MMQYGMFFQKYNPKASYFNDLIELMKDTGITNYFLRRALPYQDMKEHIQFKEEKLVMEHFYLPLLFLLVGLVAGITAFLFEKHKENVCQLIC